MSLLDRVNAGALALRRRDTPVAAARYGVDELIELFQFAGNAYPLVQTTMGQVNEESVGVTSVAGFKGSGPVFALVLARMQVFSQVRFQWTRFVGSQPSDLFGTQELRVLEQPWHGGTTSDLLARMELYASTAGCAFVTRPQRDRLSMMRPDRVTIIMGSQTDAEDPAEAPDVEIAGYIHTTGRGKMTTFLPHEVAYYAPIPDPDYRFLGMSWITPVIREMQADGLATEHKARFFQNAATPNLAIKFDPSISIDQVRRFKDLLEAEHRGVFNAYKTLYLGGGADPIVVGKDFRELDFSATQGKGESRLAAAAGVPPSWVGFSEGLQGSSLNAGNFQAARRRFADGTMNHLWTSAATSLQTLLRPPDVNTSLWFDSRVPFMREDAGDLADIQAQQAQTIGGLVKEGFTPESAIKAVVNNDWSLLRHTGWYSVQLQPPPNEQTPVNGQEPPSSDDDAPTPARHLPGVHDQKTHGKGGKRKPSLPSLPSAPSARPKLTDAEYDAHTAMIESRMGAALKGGKATDAQHAIDVDRGLWKIERARIHKEIVNELYERHAANVPSDGKAVIAGGLGGAGKSTVLRGPAHIDSKQYLTLNPDDVKEEMARRGLIPNVEGLSPMETSALVHEESSHITNLLAKRAYAEGKNVIWDITMSGKGSVQRRISELRAAGYDDLRAVFVDIPVETSVSRALARHRRGMEDHRQGKGFGGRYVPPAIIRKNKTSASSSANRQVFDSLRDDFDSWSLYDNSGTAPVLVSESSS